MSDNTIYFYSRKKAFFAFSNFSRHGFKLDGKYWPTSEHYFQAMKFEGTEHEDAIREAKSPGTAAKMGRERKRPLREDWEHVKDDIMRRAVLAKFTTHPDLKAMLMGTFDAELIEDAPNDYYWGCGRDGTGRNMLGKILMETRAILWQQRNDAQSTEREDSMTEETIYFYSTKDDYGCFSNFSRHGFELNGKYWKTSEHYFQAMKFPGTEHEEAVRIAPTPKEAANRGRERKRPLREDWESVKDDIMREAVLAKFSTHDDIRQILLDTGDAHLVENAPGDYYWGIGKDGSGKNMLGQILEEVRQILREQETDAE